MKIRSKFWLVDDDGKALFGQGRRRILEHIDELGSMQAAAKELGMSYRGVWARIKVTEERMGVKLVETAVGRGKNRGSWLTPEAKSLLENYKLLASKGITFSDRLFEEIFEAREEGNADQVATVAVAGPEGCGRSGLVAELVAELTGRGRKVGVIRLEDTNPDLLEDGRDCFNAGALSVIRSGPEALTLRVQDQENLTAEIMAANYALGCELVLVETGRRIHLPTVELYRRDLESRMLTRKQKYLLAVIGDPPEQDKGKPVYDREDVSGLADLLEETFLSPSKASTRLTLNVNGRKVPLVPFVQDFFDKALTGMVSSLKSCQDPLEIEIKIRKKK